MTLDEAILHAEEVANNNCSECGEQHKQLAKWLKELRAYREMDNDVTSTPRKTIPVQTVNVIYKGRKEPKLLDYENE